VGPGFTGREIWERVFWILSVEFCALAIEFRALSTPTGVGVSAAASTSDGLVSVAIRGSVVVSAGAADVSADVTVTGDVAVSLALGATDRFLAIFLDSDQVVVDVEAILDQLVSCFCVVYL
jgi:hypothetical protein